MTATTDTKKGWLRTDSGNHKKKEIVPTRGLSLTEKTIDGVCHSCMDDPPSDVLSAHNSLSPFSFICTSY